MFVGVPSLFTPSPPSRLTCHVFKTPPEMSTTTTEVLPARPRAKAPAQTKHFALQTCRVYRRENLLRQQSPTEDLPYQINWFSDQVLLIPSCLSRHAGVALPRTTDGGKQSHILVPGRFQLEAATTTYPEHPSPHLLKGVTCHQPHLFQIRNTLLLR